ncbi:hypothetical protein BKA70DRAFT_383064 [Coprinopsis sp. MPI-PUGE-AT-0042]|nr:hypothetical protein BKA70DRAFT_1159357 [Coprinopsis sp. MPI-PUGE-AT-0042]KAH6907029.1 hypothetical protein BKA70DRAFT_383064 [Coprinopsis sp. MPI-PUGE-AT-0042]
MLLHVTTGDPYNSNFCTEDGQVVYRAVSPFQLVGRRATIDKVVPNDEHSSDMQDRFRRIGEIKFNAISPAKITWEGVMKEVTAFFRKEKRKWGGRGGHGSDRIFTGPDGLEYRWDIGSTTERPILYLGGERKVVVAQFKKKKLGVLSSAARPATLEIDDELGKHMADIIVITLAYIEHLRRDRDD